LAGVEAFNHFHAGAGVASQRQQVNVPTLKQAQRYGGMAQALESACWAAAGLVRFSHLHVAMQSN
jgi:hypothetical protein